MSNLFPKKIFFYLLAGIFFFIIFISFQTSLLYQGQKVYTYLIFSLISNFLIIFSLRKNATYFEIFMSFFLWVGFWFKYSAIVILENGKFTEGANNAQYPAAEVIDESLFVVSVGILGFILSGYFRQYFFNYPKKIEINLNSFFYFKYRKYILFLFSLLILAVFFINIFFSIFQKGIYIENNYFIITQLISYFLLYGLATISSIILFYEFLNFKKIYFLTIFITLFENFLSSVSMLSRGMIFNTSCILLSFYQIHKKINIRINTKFFLMIILLSIFLFYLSVSLVNYLRVSKYGIGSNLTNINSTLKSAKEEMHYKIIKHSYTFDKFYSLVIRRWVGIDSVIILTEKKNILSFKILKESLNEKFVKNDLSFYEKKFTNKKNSNEPGPIGHLKGNTLPGIISYLYYSGSLTFLFFSIFILSLFGSAIEFISYKLSNRNIFFSCLIGQVIAYRFAHFGYLPANSYKLFGSILFTILLVYFLQRLINSFYK